MTIFLGLVLLWMSGLLGWTNAAILIAGVLVARKARDYLFTRWVPTARVEAEKEELIAAIKAQLAEEAVGIEGEMASLKRKLDRAAHRIEQQESEIFLLRAMLGRARQEKPAPRKPQRPATWWEILGVTANASLESAEAAYRTLARKHHPDRPEGNMARMQEINAAIAEARKARAKAS